MKMKLPALCNGCGNQITERDGGYGQQDGLTYHLWCFPVSKRGRYLWLGYPPIGYFTAIPFILIMLAIAGWDALVDKIAGRR